MSPYLLDRLFDAPSAASHGLLVLCAVALVFVGSIAGWLMRRKK